MGANKPVPREIAKQPLKPARGEGRVVRLDSWYLPPAFFSAGGPRASVEVRSSPRPLVIEGNVGSMTLGANVPRGCAGLFGNIVERMWARGGCTARGARRVCELEW